MFKKSLAVLLILVAAAIGGTMYGYYSEQETLALDAGTNMPPEPPPIQMRSKVCMFSPAVKGHNYSGTFRVGAR